MSRNAAPLSEYPTCVQCHAMGLHVSDTLARLENALGHATLIAFLRVWGGQEFDVPKRAQHAPRPPEMVRVAEWLRHEIGHGRWIVPMGPTAAQAVLSWGILTRLQAGQSIATIAAELTCHTRTVRKRKGEFTKAGLLAAAPRTERDLTR